MPIFALQYRQIGKSIRDESTIDVMFRIQITQKTLDILVIIDVLPLIAIRIWGLAATTNFRRSNYRGKKACRGAFCLFFVTRRHPFVLTVSF